LFSFSNTSTRPISTGLMPAPGGVDGGARIVVKNEREAKGKHQGEKSTMGRTNGSGVAGQAESGAPHARESDGLYQKGRLVARVLAAEIDSEAREIRFEELSNSDELLLPDDCEFQDYRILIQRVDDATKEDRTALHKGRILRGVTAEILGRREQ
jgi:hypothetical protein